MLTHPRRLPRSPMSTCGRTGSPRSSPDLEGKACGRWALIQANSSVFPRVRLSIRSDPPLTSSSNGPSPSYSIPDHTSQPSHPLIDRSTRLPRADVRSSLIAGFFDHFQSIFPFANRYSLEGRLLGKPVLGTVFMVNAICALSAR